MKRQKRALVTGATRGIGAAIATRLSHDGIDVVRLGTKDVDFADIEATRQFAREIASDDIDILVNNAGINKIGPFAEIAFEDFERIEHVNVTAPFLLMQSVVPSMRRKKWGRIVNITSIFGVISKEFRAPYSASKFALDGMTAALAAEVAVDGILANCVSPGFIETDLTRSILGDSGIAELVGRVPMRRLGKPEEVAAFVAWLVSDENTYISGQNLVIDGGFSRV